MGARELANAIQGAAQSGRGASRVLGGFISPFQALLLSKNMINKTLTRFLGLLKGC